MHLMIRKAAFARPALCRHPILRALRATAACLGILVCSPSIHAVRSSPVLPGLVIEKVTERNVTPSGLAEGDVLLVWSRGDRRGTFDSPFDLMRLEAEELPRGAITLEGTRGGESKTWVVALRDSLGLTVRPNFSAEMLALYRQKPASGEESGWAFNLKKAAEGNPPAWLPAWISLRAGETLAAAQQWDAADAACVQANADLKDVRPGVRVQAMLVCAALFEPEDWAHSKRFYEQALSEARAEDPRGLTTAYVEYSMGRVTNAVDEFSRSIELLTDAASIEETLVPDSFALSGVYHRLAYAFQYSGNLDQSLRYNELALAIRRRLVPGTISEVASTHNLGNIHTMRGEPAQAEELLQRTVTLIEKITPDSPLLVGTLIDLSTVAERRGRLAEAEDDLRRALAIAKHRAPGGAMASALNNLGLVLLGRGQTAEAIEMLTEAAKIRSQGAPESLMTASTLGNLAMAYLQEGDYRKAEEYLRTTEPIIEKAAPESMQSITLHLYLGEAALARHDLPAAESYLNRAFAIAEKQGFGHSQNMCDILKSLGDLAAERGDWAESEKRYQEAMKLAALPSPVNQKVGNIAVAMGRLKRRMHRPEEARQYFEQGLKAIEDHSGQIGGDERIRADFRAANEEGYKSYIGLLVEERDNDEALDVAERAHARSLLETLAATGVDIREGVDRELLRQERELSAAISAKSGERLQLLETSGPQSRIAGLEAELNDLLAQTQETRRRIRVSSPAYAALTEPHPLNSRQIRQELLTPGTLLLEYSLGEDHSYVFAVSPESVEARTLPARAKIEEAARALQRSMAERSAGPSGKEETEAARLRRIAAGEAEFSKAADRLSRMLLDPVREQIRGKRLLIVPDGILHYTPFAALPEPRQKSTPGGPRPPLIAGHEIVNIPSASALAMLRNERVGRRPSPKAVAVLADPVFAGEDARVHRATEVAGRSTAPAAAGGLGRAADDVGRLRDGRIYFPRLAFTRREAQAIARVTPRSEDLVALDFDASRATAISGALAEYRVVHFATHGLIDSQHPELSGLVFSLVDRQGNPQNGFLSLQDIYNLQLPAELVVLSACETGVGRAVRAEGILGMTRGFLYAGASRVMASLWKVDDAATAEMMGYFYEGMERRKMTPAAALRQAQIRMWKQKPWRSPFYWAAFQLQGEYK